MDVAEVLGQAMGATATSAFARMEIAEEEIAAAKERHPLWDAALDDMFMKLRPAAILIEVHNKVYRLHCRELLERVPRGQPLKPGTDAEVCAMFMTASLIAPPTHDTACTYIRIFKRLFPESGMFDDPEGAWLPNWQEASDDMERDLRQKAGSMARSEGVR